MASRALMLALFIGVAVLFCLTVSRGGDYSVLVQDARADVPLHDVSISITPDSQEAHVTKSQFGRVVFWGNVTVEKQQAVERVTVTLTCSSDNECRMVLSRQTMVYVSPSTQQFTLDVVIPAGVPSDSVYRVTVDAHAKSPIWEDTASDTVTVTVNQYYSLQAWTDPPYFIGEPGGSVTGDLVLTNEGNGRDTFHISLEKVPDGIEDWDFEESITVEPMFTGRVSFTLFIADDFDAGAGGARLTVIIMVESMGAKGDGLIYAKSLPMNVRFLRLEDVLLENWPNTVGLAAVISVTIAVPAFLIWRRRRRADREMEEAIEVVSARPGAG